jgi:membrane protease YdiL (CAAX protease family)
VLDSPPEPESTPPPCDTTQGGGAPVDAHRMILPADRFAAAAEVILCSGFPTQLLLIGVLAAAGMPMRSDSGQLSAPFIFLLSMLDTFLVVGLVFLLLRAHGESPRAVLLGARPIVREVMFGIAVLPVIFLGILAVLVLIVSLAPGLHNIPRNPFEDLLRTRGDAVAFGFVVMIAGGVREEIQRGFILHRFDRYLGGAVTGIVVFSVFFGLGHIEQGYDAAIATAFLGACWGTIYVIRRSIVAPMVSHAGFNLAQLAKYFVVAR